MLTDGQKLCAATELNRFVLLYYHHITEVRDYGTGELVNSVEAHLLGAIHRFPGITVTRLAREWLRSKGAVSQMASKLVKKGLIRREKAEGNAKTVHLFCTPAGEELSRRHQEYDLRTIDNTLKLLKGRVTEEELISTVRVLRQLDTLIFPPEE